MSTKHTKEPWSIQTDMNIHYPLADAMKRPGHPVKVITMPCLSFAFGQCGALVIGENIEANASRIVSCVNSCAGINPEAVPELLAACKEMLAYIEMRMAHQGCMNVKTIMENLKRDVPMVSEIETSHHLGCAETTRRVRLDKAREAIAKAEGKG
jgi:hypothetical protein